MRIFLLQAVLSVLGKESVWVFVESQDGPTGMISSTVIANSILCGVDMKLKRILSQNARWRTLRIDSRYGGVDVEELKPPRFGDGAKLDILEVGAPPDATYHIEGSLDRYLGGETWAFPSFETYCKIPQRLVHGPWTDEKSEFLEFLLKSFKKNYAYNYKLTDREAADTGLVDAIREGNMRAVKNLVPVVFLEWTENPYREDVTDNIGTDYSQPRDSDTNHPILRPEEETPPPHSLSTRPSVGLVPQTHHLRVAVLEKDCSKHIVSWLYIALDSRIDWNDEQVMEWATRKEAEGEEIGAWLLGLRKGGIVEEEAEAENGTVKSETDDAGTDVVEDEVAIED